MILRNIINRINHSDDIVVIDSVLPNKNAVGPRNSDFLEFNRQLPNFYYYAMYPMKPGNDAWFTHGYGMKRGQFKKQLKEYVKKYPEAKGKIRYLSKNTKYSFKLAYTYFLAETYTLLPFLEKNKVPFIFLLNPGGGFGLNNKSSDAMLKKIFASPYFRKVIVNQKIYKTYLIDKKLCRVQDVIFDFTGSVQFTKKDVKKKVYYGKQKDTFDICFVSAKYSHQGVDKGYDLFISAAKKLAKECKDIRMHVVGGFNENDIDTTAIQDKIKFHGFLHPSELTSFYSKMDIYISPNRPFKLYKGGSDGFPLSAGAMYCGVAGMNTDELNMNTEFKDDEVIIIKPNAKDIVEKVMYYYKNTQELYSLSEKGKKRAQKLYDQEKHIKNRIDLFYELMEKS